MYRKMMETLVRWKNDSRRKPLLMKGVRQVGKTFLLKEFGKLHFSTVHYFNFEKETSLAKIFELDLDPKKILNQLSFHTNQPIHIGTDLVIFDEIQEVPRALTSLKYFQEDCPQLHICAAGSLLDLHLNSTSFPVGKVSFETLRPLTFEEFLIANHDKAVPYLKTQESIPEIVHDHLWEQLKYYFIVGGLPEPIAIYRENKENPFGAFAKVRKKQDDLLNSYYADIAKHAGKVNAMHIDRVFRSVPSQLSKVQDSSVSRFKFRGVIPGISHYDRIAGAIDWLQNTGMILKVSIVNSPLFPLRGYARENIFKLFLFDIGILGAMSNLSPRVILDYDYGTYKGFFAENFVAQALQTDHLFSWEEKTAEVEFLLEIDGKIIPVEVKSGSVTHAKSLKQFSEKYKPLYQILLSGKPLNLSGKLKRYPLYLTDSIARRAL